MNARCGINRLIYFLIQRMNASSQFLKICCLRTVLTLDRPSYFSLWVFFSHSMSLEQRSRSLWSGLCLGRLISAVCCDRVELWSWPWTTSRDRQLGILSQRDSVDKPYIKSHSICAHANTLNTLITFPLQTSGHWICYIRLPQNQMFQIDDHLYSSIYYRF